MIRCKDKFCRTVSTLWAAPMGKNLARALRISGEKVTAQCLIKSLLQQSTPCTGGNLPNPLSAHTRYRKQSSVSFPGCFCSYSVYCDGHITTYVLTEWGCCASQVPIHVLSFLQDAVRRPQWGRGGTQQFHFILLASLKAIFQLGNGYIWCSENHQEWKGESSLFL